jgi:tRNA threonylcarbamoyladenosine biosynthesis protein TsaE
MDKKLIESNSEEETIELGKKFAGRLVLGDIVSLYGELGAGKTNFVKGICEYFEVEEMITSPTFTIINQYYGTKDDEEITIFHIDLYRMKSGPELNYIGFPELLESKDSIKIIEWAEKSYGTLDGIGYSVKILTDEKDENKRYIDIEVNK